MSSQNKTVRDLRRVEKNHLRYNSEELNGEHHTHKQKIKNLYSEMGFNVPFNTIADHGDVTQGYQNRSNMRKERIEELKNYLGQKIAISSDINPYYDNSFQPHTRKLDRGPGYTGGEKDSESSSDQIFSRIREEEASQIRKKHNYNIPLTPPEDNFIGGKEKLYGETDQKQLEDPDAPFYEQSRYVERIRGFGFEGEERHKRNMEQEKGLADELLMAIKIKKMRKQKEKEEEIAREEAIERHNKEYFERQGLRMKQENQNKEEEIMQQKGIRFNRKKAPEFEGSEKDIEEESKAFFNSLDLKMKLEEEKNSTDEQSRYSQLNDTSASQVGGYTGRSAKKYPTIKEAEYEEDSLSHELQNQTSSRHFEEYNNNHRQGGQQEEEKRKEPETLEEYKQRNIENMLDVRQKSRELYREMNILTAQRYKMQAHEIYSCIKHDEAIEDLKNLDNDLRRQNFETSSQLAEMNLQYMNLWPQHKKQKQNDYEKNGDNKRGGFKFDQGQRIRNLDDLKLYMKENSILSKYNI